jgi:hypothetical protein
VALASTRELKPLCKSAPGCIRTQQSIVSADAAPSGLHVAQSGTAARNFYYPEKQT